LLRSSQYLSSYSAWVGATGSGNIKIHFDIRATSLADSVGAYKIIVQAKSGSNWTNAQTYWGSSTSGMLGSNCLLHLGDVTYSGTPGVEYRAIVTAYSKIGSGSDSSDVTTSSVIA
jgi:hypothetical protein